MSNIKSKTISRLLAAFLSLVMVLSMLPITSLTVLGATINDVTIEAKNLTYQKGVAQELVSVTKLDGDTVKYQLEGEAESSEVPTRENVGRYNITVTVSRPGEDDLVENVTATINPATIEGISIEEINAKYNEGAQNLVKLNGSFEEDDSVVWTVNGTPVAGKGIPQETAVGTYQVALTVDRGSNYEKLVLPAVTSNILEGDLALGDLSIKGLEGVYMIDSDGNPVAQAAVSVENKGNYNLKYQLDNGNLTVDDSAWVDEIPTVTDAGSYIVWVKAVKDSYNDADVTVTPAESAVAPYNVYIAKAEQSFTFDHYSGTEGSDEISDAFPYDKEYDFSATDQEALAGGTITYSVVTDEEGIASINETTGLLTVNYPGFIKVVATLSGNANYNECVIEYNLDVSGVVSSQGQYISFANNRIDYVIGTSNIIADQEAVKTDNKIKGSISYELDQKPGVSINESTGQVTVTDYDALANAIQETDDGSLEITVTATKNQGGRYGIDTASYVISITFEPTPTTPYTLPDIDGTNGWYISNVDVTAANGYEIAKAAGDTFTDKVTFSDQGSETRYVYLKNTTSGGITDKIAVDVNIDSADPTDLYISFSELNLIQKIGLALGFYNPNVTITFTAKDVTSGIDHFDWTYTPESGNPVTNELAVTYEGDVATATLNLPATQAEQMHGKISFTATDKASNESGKKSDYVFIVDTIAPELSVKYQGQEPYTAQEDSYNGAHFFNSDVAVELSITETNFYAEDVKVKISKNGATATEVIPSWNGKVGTFTLAGDGHYVVHVSYTDKANNKMEDYTSETIIIDTIAPEINVEYTAADRVIGKDCYYNNGIDVKLTMTEANFYAEDIVVTVTKNGEDFNYGTVTWGNRNAEDKTVGTFTLPALADHTGDGQYVITVEYTDKSNNEMVKYVSDIHTIDTTKPVINVEYQNKNIVNKLTDRDGNERAYFADTQEAIVTITEHNFIADEVEFMIVAKDVTGAELNAATLSTKSEWKVDSTGDVHTITITYPGDANYTFDIAYSDKATNPADDYATDCFTVDKTAPTNMKVDYSTSVLDTVLEFVTFGFYNAKMTVTLTAEDMTSEVHSFLYSYLNAVGVSSVNAELINEAIKDSEVKYSADRKTATVTFEIPKMVLGNDDQFNGTVEFTATDRAGNEADAHKETKRIVVDNIAPTAQVTYNEATNTVGDISYYNGNITATVTINEANFYANDVKVMVSKDGGAATTVTPTWIDKSVDVHVGTFTLTEDGDYTVTINYTDKSSNRMTTYTSKQMTIDTEIEVPTYTINGKAKTEIGGAYKGDATIGFNFTDQNFATKDIKLTRSRLDKVEDVTETFIKVADDDKGGAGSFDIPSEVENDGIYVLKISMTDKAGHETESEIKFTINRFGSVYEYSDELAELIKDGGQYIQSVDTDLVITEYNADRINEGSLKILVTRDGETVETDFTSNPENINSQVAIGESGWYQYVYTIKRSTFEKDGVYKISLTSAYDADDVKDNASTSVPENSLSASGEEILDTMTFTVDSVAPEIRNIVNLDKSIVDVDKIVDGKLNVKYSIVDVGGLKTIEIVVNGKTVQTLTEEDIADNAYNFSGSFDIAEQDGTAAQKVRLVVTDLAGNVTDTDSDDFRKAHSENNENSTYVFFNEVTVSRNSFVRWYANTGLFWGSIAGVTALAGGTTSFVAFKRKKKVVK